MFTHETINLQFSNHVGQFWRIHLSVTIDMSLTQKYVLNLGATGAKPGSSHVTRLPEFLVSEFWSLNE